MFINFTHLLSWADDQFLSWLSLCSLFIESNRDLRSCKLFLIIVYILLGDFILLKSLAWAPLQTIDFGDFDYNPISTGSSKKRPRKLQFVMDLAQATAVESDSLCRYWQKQVCGKMSDARYYCYSMKGVVLEQKLIFHTNTWFFLKVR